MVTPNAWATTRSNKSHQLRVQLSLHHTSSMHLSAHIAQSPRRISPRPLMLVRLDQGRVSCPPILESASARKVPCTVHHDLSRRA